MRSAPDLPERRLSGALLGSAHVLFLPERVWCAATCSPELIHLSDAYPPMDIRFQHAPLSGDHACTFFRSGPRASRIGSDTAHI